MAVAAADLRAPVGLIEPAMYPGLDAAAIDAIIDEYIADGEDRVGDLDAEDQDAAVTAWAYYRAFKARSIQLASMPASIAVPNEESTTRTADQRATFDALAREHYDAFYAMFEEDISTSVIPPSGSSSTRITW